jgi:hypothetical protein
MVAIHNKDWSTKLFATFLASGYSIKNLAQARQVEQLGLQVQGLLP